MTLSCTSNTIKYLILVFNFFFMISGIIILAVGATVKTVYTEYSYFLDDKYFSLPNMLIATGSLIFFISFFGCCGAFRESWIMLSIFSVLLVIIFIFEFSAGIAGYVLRDKTFNYLEDKLKANLKNYPNGSYATWDLIQSNFECCGVNTYEDWFDVFQYDLPISCCPKKAGSTGAFYCNSYKPTSTISTTIISSSISPNPNSTTTETITTGTTESTTASTTTSTTNTTTSTTSTTASITSTTASITTSTTEITTETNEANTTDVTPNPSTTSPYPSGCATVFGDFVKKHAVQIGGCALGLAILQILGIIFSCYLVHRLKNSYYST